MEIQKQNFDKRIEQRKVLRGTMMFAKILFFQMFYLCDY